LITIGRAFEREPGFSSHLCTDWKEALAVGQQAANCVLIVSESLLSEATIAALRAHTPNWHILVNGHRIPDRSPSEWFRKGFVGYLNHDSTPDMARKAVEHVLAGELWADRKVMSDMVRLMSPTIHDTRFTRREREVLEKVAAGLDNRRIAEDLFVTRETVRWHLRTAYAKLGIHDRAALVALAH
jgi:DNA-binding NarL/FixJ family response regulator